MRVQSFLVTLLLISAAYSHGATTEDILRIQGSEAALSDWNKNYRSLSQLDSGYVSSRLILAKIHTQSRKYSQAISALNEALPACSTKKQRSEILTNSATLHELAGSPSVKIRNAWNRVLAEDGMAPEAATAQFALLKRAWADGAITEAEARLREWPSALRAAPEYAEATRWLSAKRTALSKEIPPETLFDKISGQAKKLVAENRADRAIALFLKAASESTTPPPMRHALKAEAAGTAFNAGEFELAGRIANEALSTGEPTPDGALRMHLIAIQSALALNRPPDSRQTEAIEKFLKQAKLPEDQEALGTEARETLRTVFLKRGDSEAASRIPEEIGSATTVRLSAYLRQGKSPDNEEDIIPPNEPGEMSALLRAAEMASAQNDRKRAAVLFAQIARHPKASAQVVAYASLRHAVTLHLDDKPILALGAYQKFLSEKKLKSSPYAVPALLRAANLCAGPLEKPRDGIRFLKAVTEIAPNSPSADTAEFLNAVFLDWARDTNASRKVLKDYLKNRPSGSYREAAEQRLAQK